jgi:sporulation protein YlmC with PRC-barrel domain
VLSRIFVLAAFTAAALVSPLSHANSNKASSLVGQVVVTPQGELLGRVEDIAVNVEQKRVDFVVVSIGSFLVDDNLIAVHPDALGRSEDGRYLVVYSDDLNAARRFGANRWPSAPDVMPSADREPVEAAELAAEQVEGERGATISDGRRTATMKAGERTAQIESAATGRPQNPASGVRYKRFTDGQLPAYMADSEFQRLDEDRDGYLSRSEIGPRLRSGVRYQDFDVDDNDGIDPFEFQLMKEG